MFSHDSMGEKGGGGTGDMLPYHTVGIQNDAKALQLEVGITAGLPYRVLLVHHLGGEIRKLHTPPS